MVQMTMQVSNDLAKPLKSIRNWLPTILELSFVGFKSLAQRQQRKLSVFFYRAITSSGTFISSLQPRAIQNQLMMALNQAWELGDLEKLDLDEL